MAAEEDILLREVDDDLKQDQTIAFFKKYGGLLIGAAVMTVVAVVVVQFMRGAEARAAAKGAEIYEAAVTRSEETPTEGAAIMLEAAGQTSSGYAGLARLRAAAFQIQDGDIEGALSSLMAAADADDLPDRIRDSARLKAAHLLIDTDPGRAKALAAEVSSEAMLPLAQELTALADLAMGDYEAAYAGFSRLADTGLAAIPSGVVTRAQMMAPVADAARRGVPLEAQESEAESFIRSFSQQLNEELDAPEETPLPDGEVTPDGEDNQ